MCITRYFYEVRAIYFYFTISDSLFPVASINIYFKATGSDVSLLSLIVVFCQLFSNMM